MCVITGCAILRGDGYWLPGDLFLTEDGTFIFNGPAHNAVSTPEDRWNGGTPHYTKQITLHDWWERRGVFVIELRHMDLNPAAREYLNGQVLPVILRLLDGYAATSGVDGCR